MSLDQTIKKILPRGTSRYLTDIQAELTALAFNRLDPPWAAGLAGVTMGESVAAYQGHDFTLWGVALVLLLTGFYAYWIRYDFRRHLLDNLTPAETIRWQTKLGAVMVVTSAALASADIHFFLIHDLSGEILSSMVMFAAGCFLRSLHGALPWIGQTCYAIMLIVMAAGFLVSDLPNPALCAACAIYGNFVLWQAEGGKFDLIAGQLRARLRERQVIEEDDLTGLASQVQFKTSLNVTGRLGCGFTVLLINLDHFKNVNAQFGTAVGDRVLKLVAARLKSVSRGSDLIARLEADEFAILAQEPATEAAAQALAQRISRTLAMPFGIDNRSIELTASMGIWVGSEGKDRPEEAMRHALEALRKAKAAGGSRVQFA